MRRLALRSCAPALLLVAGAVLAAPLPNTCTPEVIGTWKLESSTLPQTTLLRFDRDGWASLLSGASDQPAQSYEILAQVSYSFAPTRNPRRLDFSTPRGNDMFAAGSSHWEIIGHGDQGLTTHAADAAAGAAMSWSRIATQRYFLTLASRAGTPHQSQATVVMWTTLGSTLELEALGAMADGPEVRFGRIPIEQTRAFTRDSGGPGDVMMRIELNEAEYHRTHRVLEAWDAVLRNDRLARNDPMVQLAELFDATLQSVNRCTPRLQLPQVAGGTVAGSGQPQQRLREIRRLNDKRHVSDRGFPFGWKPPAVG